MLLIILGVAGSIASLVGLYAIYENRRNRRLKLLAYEPTQAVPLATASTRERDYSLSIHYRAAGAAQEEVIEAAWVRYLRFANFGREPIRREDIAPANPLRVEVEGSRVLDVALVTSRRDVTSIDVGRPVITPERATALVTFDFLDYRDGGVVRVLITDPGARVQLVGDIIGQPGGVIRSDATPARSRWGFVGVVLWIVAEVISFSLAAWVIQEVAGSWEDIWLLLLPLAAFAIPVAVALSLEGRWPSGGHRFPEELALPRWLHTRMMMPHPMWLVESELDESGYPPLAREASDRPSRGTADEAPTAATETGTN